MVAKQVAFPAKALVAAARQIAEGDVDIRLAHKSGDEMGELTERFRVMAQALRRQGETLQAIAGGGYTVQALATGSTQQAATLQEFSATIAHVESQAGANTQLTDQTVQEVTEAGRLMGESLGHMREMTAAVQGMEANSREIAKVIKVIDDIAFQTNILALNAAAEAARAG